MPDKTLEQVMRDKADELRGLPIVERTPGEKAAYRQAYKAGAADALRLVERHGLEKAREDVGHLTRVLDTLAEQENTR